MKPDWDKLMGQFKGHASTLVADVDCTAAGKPLCDSNGVRGFPTIKHGDPAALEDYQGGRDWSALETFAKGLKPSCSPGKIELCDDESAASIKKFMAMDSAALNSAIEVEEKKNTEAEKTFKDAVAKLQANYEKLSTDKDATLAAVKASGLGMMKSVKAHLAKA